MLRLEKHGIIIDSFGENMERIIRKCAYTLVLSSLITLSGCKFSLTGDNLAQKNFETFISNVENKNYEALYETFSKITKTENNNLNNEILALCDFYKGSFVEIYNNNTHALITDDAIHNRKYVTTYIFNYSILTSEDSFSFIFNWRITDDYDKDNEGLIGVFVEQYIDKDSRTKPYKVEPGVTINYRQ